MALPPTLARRLAGAALLLLAGAASARPSYQPGERVRFSGYVTDPAGTPMAQITVMLELSRESFDLLHLSRERKDITRLSTVTNEQGEYSLEWPWSSYYNHLELLAGVPVRAADGEHLKVLERVDVSQKSRRGSPVVSALVVRDSAYVTSLRQFLASIETEEQQHTYQEVGAPDKVERFDYPDRREVSWWYFALGKVYRFRDGKLDKVETFDPVQRF
ncbi:MAG TPA: carboxypeptidase-like regulatory domain-containing protein [Thermoanaerobaculia bacterium]|nr:carboxypeptidase-like regulatory domain-containing protein [Thermoanaerobaculia bacterium]